MVYSADQVNQMVLDYVNKTITHVSDVEEVWLFGSYSRGTSNEDSDIDLAVVSERFTNDLPMAMVDLYDAVWDMDVGVSIQIHGFTRDEFKGGQDLLAQEVQRTGKCVYSIH